MTPKPPLFFLLFTITFFLIVGVAEGLNETRSFEIDGFGVDSHYETSAVGSFYAASNPYYLRFADLGFYSESPPTSILFTVPDSAVYSDPSTIYTKYDVSLSSADLSFTADITIMPVEATGQVLLFITDIQDFEVTDTGVGQLTIPLSDWKGFAVDFHNSAIFETGGAIDLVYGDYIRGVDNLETDVTTSVNWKNDYILSGGEIPPYNLTVIRDGISGYDGRSSWKVWDGATLISDEASSSSENFTINLNDYHTTIEVQDYYGLGSNYVYYPSYYEEWEDDIYWIDEPLTYRIHGYVYSSAGGLLNNAIIDIDDLGSSDTFKNVTDMGYYYITLTGPSIYEVTGSKSGFLNSSQNVSIIPSSPLTQHDIVLFENITESLDTGKSGIQGLVRDYNTGALISSARVQIAGEVAYTNEVGYYQLINIDPDQYSITASHPSYNAVSDVVNLTADNITTFDINLIPLEGVTDPDGDGDADGEESPEDRTVKAVYDLFGLIGLPAGWLNSIVALVLIIMAVMAVSLVSSDTTVMIISAFIAFVVCIALGLLPQSFLAIVIIVIIAGILHIRGS